MNIEGFTIDLERCPDGVELVDSSGSTVFRYRTDRRISWQHTIASLENPVVVAFVNATNDDQRQQFFSQFGLMKLIDRADLIDPGMYSAERPRPPRRTLREEIHHDTVVRSQWWFRELLQSAGGEDQAAAMAELNAINAERRAFDLTATFYLAGPRGVPRVLLKSQTFVGLMMLEAAMIASHGARTHECEHCSIIFLTGPQTWRRAHARFCSDKCRVAAMRARTA